MLVRAGRCAGDTGTAEPHLLADSGECHNEPPGLPVVSQAVRQQGQAHAAPAQETHAAHAPAHGAGKGSTTRLSVLSKLILGF